MGPNIYTVPEGVRSLRADKALAIAFPEHSRTALQRAFDAERVRLRGAAIKRDQAVVGGDVLEFSLPEVVPTELKAVDIPLDVIFEDKHMLAVNKPSGMVVHPAAGHDSGTLVNALLHRITDLSGIGGELRPGIVHRLDKGTSGLIVVAKNDRAHEALSRQFAEREVEKEYVALVWGVVQAGRGIDLPIGRDPNDRQKMSAKARRARHAVTRITKAHHFRGVTLCQVAIQTGRTHQIRVHFKFLGYPLVGDSVYGHRQNQRISELTHYTAPRQMLHAYNLGFIHPRTGKRLNFEAPRPADFQDALSVLRG